MLPALINFPAKDIAEKYLEKGNIPQDEIFTALLINLIGRFKPKICSSTANFAEEQTQIVAKQRFSLG